MKAFFKLLTTLSLCLITQGCGEKVHHRDTQKDTFVVGMMSGYAPFMVINTRGQYEGFDVDIANHLAQKLGKKLVIKEMAALPPQFIALNQGRIDCLISGLCITQSRKQEFIMIHYQGENVTHFPLAFWKKATPGITKFEDLIKLTKPVCVEAGTPMEEALKLFGTNIRLMERYVDMMMDVQYGKSAAVLLEPATVGKLKEMFPELVSIDLLLPEHLIVEGNGIALKKDNPELAKKLEEIITEMKRDGTIKALEHKWKMS